MWAPGYLASLTTPEITILIVQVPVSPLRLLLPFLSRSLHQSALTAHPSLQLISKSDVAFPAFSFLSVPLTESLQIHLPLAGLPPDSYPVSTARNLQNTYAAASVPGKEGFCGDDFVSMDSTCCCLHLPHVQTGWQGPRQPSETPPHSRWLTAFPQRGDSIS